MTGMISRAVRARRSHAAVIEPDGMCGPVLIEGERRPAAGPRRPVGLQGDWRVECPPTVARSRRLDLRRRDARGPQHSDLRILRPGMGGQRHARRKLSAEARFARNRIHRGGRTESQSRVSADRDEDVGPTGVRCPKRDGDKRSRSRHPRGRARSAGDGQGYRIWRLRSALARQRRDSSQGRGCDFQMESFDHGLRASGSFSSSDL